VNLRLWTWFGGMLLMLAACRDSARPKDSAASTAPKHSTGALISRESLTASQPTTQPVSLETLLETLMAEGTRASMSVRRDDRRVKLPLDQHQRQTLATLIRAAQPQPGRFPAPDAEPPILPLSAWPSPNYCIDVELAAPPSNASWTEWQILGFDEFPGPTFLIAGTYRVSGADAERLRDFCRKSN